MGKRNGRRVRGKEEDKEEEEEDQAIYSHQSFGHQMGQRRAETENPPVLSSTKIPAAAFHQLRLVLE